MGLFAGETTITSNSSITVGGYLSAISTGSYYMYSKTASQSLISVVASCFSTSLGSTVTATLSSGGILTLSAGVSFAINWGSSTDIRDMLGFAGNRTPATSHTAELQLKYIWIPKMTNGLTAEPTVLSSSYTRQGIPFDYITQSYAVDGSVFTNYLGGVVEQEISFDHLSLANTWENAAERSFEEFYNDIARLGTPFVWIPLYPTTTYEHEYILKMDNENKPNISRIGQNDLFWKTTMTMRGI